MIPFNNLKPAYNLHRNDYEAAMRRVFARGWFILGPELEAFEDEFAAYHGGGHAVGVASGTDALELALRAASIGPGDEVITVSHTAVATVCAVERAGARPVLVDIDPLTYTIDPAAVRAAITPRTRAVIPVHLYGHPADLEPLRELTRAAGLCLLEDCAQAHGARYMGRPVGTFGDLAAFSCYPTKNLGAFGDAGAVLTTDALLAERVRRLRNYGQTQRYQHAQRGVNSRLDELQAALLRARLPYLDEHNAERARLASRYREQLAGVELPWPALPGRAVEHAWHLFVVRHPARDALRRRLLAQGVETLIHYPVPIHLQPAYADLGYRAGSLPATERAAREVLSLPLYVGLGAARVDRVAEAVRCCSREAA
ncbi:MAG: DegT/DnrJ/EryC1/StrS family aminotransferase [Gemmataceae bacterium]|nr:DegT/DnrJ/EryC1/StrS family aminotransferase [Gemmataceae bacterium]